MTQPAPDLITRIEGRDESSQTLLRCVLNDAASSFEALTRDCAACQAEVCPAHAASYDRFCAWNDAARTLRYQDTPGHAPGPLDPARRRAVEDALPDAIGWRSRSTAAEDLALLAAYRELQRHS